MRELQKITFLFAALTIGVTLPGVGDTGAQAAATSFCHNFLVKGATASAIKKSKAKKRARKKWSSKAVSVMGSRAGDWDIARSKSYQCSKAGLWYCKAIAAPCKYRASGSGSNQKKL